ncbi:ethylbenzene dehydrogenase-related protein [Natroniella sulfidigena]|uniref:ethylbenzene dehydrogenase-related protein n=1 Tax=Natroniella sulfidigena TaxID=723921 RepID=UPI00200A0069|nr:ethylbenzene dehydrogenase-related protein [Natroniella sulfidigena]MCK8816152.1 ethylbenzene dehydrogenase-related protein [Natroniella sulfidigena]
MKFKGSKFIGIPLLILLSIGLFQGFAQADNRYIPDELKTTVRMQVAYNDEDIFFRYNWDSKHRGWFHDYLVYQDGEWVRYGAPPVGPDKYGLYEDRMTVMIDDGSVKGFDNFGGWLTVHDGLRALDTEVSSASVQEDEHLGENLDRNDVRKFIPQSRKGDQWWEGVWDEALSQEKLDDLLDKGIFVDLWQWRAHRGNPIGTVDDGYVLDYRHGDDGQGAFTNNPWDEETGPKYMFDPDEVGFAALDFEKLKKGEYDMDEIYYLHEDFMIPLDEEQMFEGAAIPRRPLQEPEGSRAVIDGDSTWEDDQYTVEMRRELDTGYIDDKAFEEGKEYTIALGLFKNSSGSRWHYISYPYELRLGADADIEATYIEGDQPDWNQIEEYEIPVIYPGQVTWSWLTSEDHAGYEEVRNNEVSIWDIHENPKDMAKAAVMLEEPARLFRQPFVILAMIIIVGSIILIIAAIREIKELN